MNVGTLKTLIVGASILGISTAFAQQNVTPQPGPRTDLGKLSYESNCATCHGLTGKGDGPMAIHLVRKVPDLTTLARANNGILPVSEMYNVIVGEKHHLMARAKCQYGGKNSESKETKNIHLFWGIVTSEFSHTIRKHMFERTF